MSRYTLFLDVAGRVAKETCGYEYVTCAGVAIESSAVTSARASLRGSLPKWKNSEDADLMHIAEFIAEHYVTTLCPSTSV